MFTEVIMKAMIIEKHGEIDDIQQIEIDKPQAGEDGVLVKVKASSINPADLKVVSGKDGGAFIHSGRSPIRLGFDFSGTVEETGEEVFGFLPYSRSTTQGSYAEYVTVRKDTIAKKPESVSFTEAAACATTAATAWDCLVNIGAVKKGYKVLVNGASGGVGSFGVQIAKYFGATVWGTCSDASMEFVKSIGAHQVLDYKKIKLADIDESFDIILDAVSNSSYGECSGIMAPKGVYVTLLPSLGFLTGKIRSLFSSKQCSACIVKPVQGDLSQIAELLESKDISSPVAEAYPLEKLKEAMKRLKSGGVKGKIAVTIN